jgi:hypothetical protein
VWAQRSSCESVTERESLVGRFSFVSRLPQYLSPVRGGRGPRSGVDSLDGSDIHRGGGARSVYRLIRHCVYSTVFN